ncbi:MAG: choice-of-anchor tandem repeat GloVer-containing protein [Verrucomicrobiota bacterium]|jgi:uncharacterized repeat protein (TIGR03803 family)
MRTNSILSSLRTAIFSVVLCVGLGAVSEAQIYNILHNFGGTGYDGYAPLTDLVLNGSTLYGTTASGGTNYNGTIFKINTDGSGYGIIRSLTNSPSPEGGMVLIGNTLYGTTFTGGSADNGSIFKINTDGSGYTELHSFSATVPSTFGTNSDGNRPQADLVTDGTTLYGTARLGGAAGNGTVFKINADGLGFAVIKTFPATFLGTNNVSGSPLEHGTNSDGSQPTGSLVLDGTTLYGTTYHGGISNGVVFAMQTDGSGYTVLKYFSGINGIGTNSDGAAPVAGLTLGGDTLYGVTVGGGVAGCGNIFKLKTNGAGFTDLHDFLHSDGAFPRNTLFLDGSTLYGTTAAGGSSNYGTIFMILTNGAGFTTLENFDMAVGLQCDSKFVLSSNTLYGTAADGGTNGGGVVFGLTVLPQILTGDGNFGVQANAFGFDITGISNQAVVIQTCTNLVSPDWLPIQTNTLNGGPVYFSDPQWINYSACFYRLCSP